jgi:hypothetical protein
MKMDLKEIVGFMCLTDGRLLRHNPKRINDYTGRILHRDN